MSDAPASRALAFLRPLAVLVGCLAIFVAFFAWWASGESGVRAVSLSRSAQLVALVSGLLAIAWSFIPWRSLRLLLVFAAPCLVAWKVYWWPNPQGTLATEYGVWAALSVLPMAAMGMASSLAVALVAWAIRRRRAGRQGEP